MIPFRFLTILFASTLACFGELGLLAPNPSFPPVNQLLVSGNACGPAALLNAFGFGNAKWQELGTAIPAKSNRQRLTYVIRGHGLKQSSHLDRLRWTKTTGVNLLDLTDMANELRGSRWMAKINNETFIREHRETNEKLIRRIYSRLTHSMKKGLPPIISLQRLARPTNKPASALEWRIVHSHFVVVTGLPAKLDKNATSIPFSYVDPWGGKSFEGQIRIDTTSSYPAASVTAPQSNIGKRALKPGEHSIIALAAGLGVF